jgi:tetratricopeptide (TPR) repeat protein
MPEAESLFKESLRLDPESAQAECNLGKALAGRGARVEALEHLRRAVAWEPENASWHSALGIVLAEQGKVEEGIKELQTAIRLDPNDIEARNELAKIYSTRGNRPGAVEQWREVLQRAPRYFAANKGIGMALLENGRAAAAVRFLQNALAVGPGDLETRKCLAFAWLAVGRVSNAIGEFQEMLRQDATEGVALNSLAWLRATHPDKSIRNGAEAVKLAQKAVAMQKEDQPVLLDTLAAAYAEAGRYKEAIQTAEKAQAAAIRAGDKQLGGSIQERVALYRTGKPYRDTGIQAKHDKK